MVRKVRPARFIRHLAALVRDDPQPTRTWTFDECGYTQTPYGLLLGLPTHALVYWQAVTTARPGDPGTGPEEPVHATPPPALTMPTLPTHGLTQIRQVEQYMGALLTQPGNTETETVRLYGDWERAAAVPYGLGVRFHNGSRICLYARHCLPAEHTLTQGEQAFRRRDVI